MGRVGRPPLNPRGGKAQMVGTKLADAELRQLDQLAAERGVSRSVIVRELISQGLATGPPDREVTSSAA